MESLVPATREVLWESLLHAGTMVPVLFSVFLLIESVSHRARPSLISQAMGHRLGGPVAASALGLLPQCGFSVAATMLYVDGLIPIGSLLASYIATSDEAVPILLSDRSSLRWVFPLLAVKLVWGIAIGSAMNLALPRGPTPPEDTLPRERIQEADRQEMACRHHPRGCVGEPAGRKALILHAARRTARTTAVVFVLSSVLGLVGHGMGPWISAAMAGRGIWGPAVSSVIGMIPSCATSVALAEGFRSGLLSFPSLLSGLTANAGLGLLVLARESRDTRRTLTVALLLMTSALVVGTLANVLLPLTGR